MREGIQINAGLHRQVKGGARVEQAGKDGAPKPTGASGYDYMTVFEFHGANVPHCGAICQYQADSGLAFTAEEPPAGAPAHIVANEDVVVYVLDRPSYEELSQNAPEILATLLANISIEMATWLRVTSAQVSELERNS